MNALRIRNYIALFSLCLLITMGFSGYATSQEQESLKTQKSPVVVVSITPFYALVSAIMQGVSTPKLLVNPSASPHDYALRPSDLKLLSQADVIFWGGPQLESFLIKPLASDRLKSSVRVFQLDQTPDLLLLPLRRQANFEAHTHTHKHNHEHEHDCAHETVDMHFWLDPNNAIKMVDAIVSLLSESDPKHHALYQKNAAAFKNHLKQVDASIAQQLNPVKKIPYIVFHDAYQYFERHYGLNGVGAISLHPEIPLSVQRLQKIHTLIETTKARCVFSEPQFSSPLVQSLVEGTSVKTGQLDPLGSSNLNDPEAYAHLLENLALSLNTCLKSEF